MLGSAAHPAVVQRREDYAPGRWLLRTSTTPRRETTDLTV
jgi:hypothetical protein